MEITFDAQFWTFLVFFVCFGVSIALAVLGGWHVILITKGETSIEVYTNRSEAYSMKKQGKVSTHTHIPDWLSTAVSKVMVVICN